MILTCTQSSPFIPPASRQSIANHHCAEHTQRTTNDDPCQSAIAQLMLIGYQTPPSGIAFDVAPPIWTTDKLGRTQLMLHGGNSQPASDANLEFKLATTVEAVNLYIYG